MEITARLTGDATISNLKTGKQVVNFTVAINHNYKTKGSAEPVRTATYVQCGYWVNTTIAKYLTKGTLVELQGRVGVNAYVNKDGQPRATITLHVNSIKMHGSGGAKQHHVLDTAVPSATETADDLPF